MFSRVSRSLSLRSLFAILLFALGAGTASAQKIALIFQNTTAPYAALGAPIDYVLDISNMGVGTVKVNSAVTLTAPDNTVYTVFSETPTIFSGDTHQIVRSFTISTSTSQPGALLHPGTSMTSSFIVNTSQYSNVAGTYGLRVDVYDSSNHLLATDTHNFTRNAIPPGTYVPKFTDKASTSGMLATRLQPPPPPGCGNF